MQQRSRGPRPRFFDDPQLDRFHVTLVALVQELAVVHDRVDALERVLESGGNLSRAELEAYEPDDIAAVERDEWRDAFVQRVMRVIFEEAVELAQPVERYPTVQDVITAVSTT